MNKFYLLFFYILLNSCAYPDIDSVPEFSSVKMNMQDDIEICKIRNSVSEVKQDCFEEMKNIIKGL